MRSCGLELTAMSHNVRLAEGKINREGGIPWGEWNFSENSTILDEPKVFRHIGLL